jgi:DNA polymerase I-like protein with 3'-5' exonuclease and polymerase domains
MNIITLDFETFYSKDYSLSKMTTEAYVRDPRFEVIGVSVKVNDQVPTWFSGPHDQVAAWLQQFDIPNSFLLCHHTAFDGFILSHHFNIRPKFYLCTMSMARPLHGQTIGVSLKALSDRYTIGIKGDDVILALGKRRADFKPDELARYGSYCCNDVQLCYILFQILKKELPQSEVQVIDLLLRMFIEPVLELDTDMLTNHLVTVRRKKEELLSQVTEIAGPDALRSNPKFALLLRTLGIEPPIKISPRTGKETYAFSKTDVEFKALLEHEDTRVQAVVSARLGTRSTIEETRTERFLGIAERGRLPIYLNYYGANGTGRASGGDKVNLQNLPRGGALRQAIRAPKGHVVIAGDSSNIEARILPWLAGQNDLVSDFAAGVDAYAKFATDVYGYTVHKDTHPTERFVGKTCILGLGYQTGAAKLQNTLAVGKPPVKMELKETKRLVYLYRDKYSRIPKLWEIGEHALLSIVRGEEYAIGQKKTVHTSQQGIHLPNGMVIRYPCLLYHNNKFAYVGDRRQQAEWVKQELSGKYDTERLTQIYGGKVIENVVQALARIVVFDQMLVIARRYRAVLTVHDEIVICVPEKDAGEARGFVISTMSTAPAWAEGLPVACEANMGAAYGDAK